MKSGSHVSAQTLAELAVDGVVDYIVVLFNDRQLTLIRKKEVGKLELQWVPDIRSTL